jgi:hypothetical protein
LKRRLKHLKNKIKKGTLTLFLTTIIAILPQNLFCADFPQLESEPTTHYISSSSSSSTATDRHRVDGSKIVFWTTLDHDLKVESSSCRGFRNVTYTGEDHLVDVVNLDKSRLFGVEEDITIKEEEIVLNGFEMGFETRVSVSTRRDLGLYLLTKMKMDRPLEAS